MGARALPAAMDRGAERGPAVGGARSSRRAPAVQRVPFAPPLDHVRVGAVGPIWAKREHRVRRYGVLRARSAKSVLADVFQYLIVVCSMSKKSLFPWQIPRAEFRALFQDPIRAGAFVYII